MPTNTNSFIKKEIARWDERVFFPDVKFKEDTPADLKVLDNIIEKAKENFVIISSETEGCVYKIGRYFIEKGIENSSITFQDGDIFSSYIDVNTKYDSEIRNLCNSLVSIIEHSARKKWLIVPSLDCKWSKKFAIYFINKLKEIEVYGFLFYSNPNYPDTLAQILCEETYEEIYQFPKENFKTKKSKHKLAPDRY